MINKTLLLFLALSLSSYDCQGQSDEKKCSVNIFEKNSYLESKIPQGVCLDSTWEVYSLYSDFDFNQDGIADFTLVSRRVDLQEGDSIRLDIFQMKNEITPDSQFTYFNLLPQYFSRYDYEHIVSLPQKIIDKYHYNGGYPLGSLKFAGDSITIDVRTIDVEGYELTFRYSPLLSDWELVKTREWVKDYYGNIRYQIIEWEKITLREFRYIDFM